jgi:hypothetical protein
LSTDCPALSRRLHQLQHTITTDCAGLTLRSTIRPSDRERRWLVNSSMRSAPHCRLLSAADQSRGDGRSVWLHIARGVQGPIRTTSTIRVRSIQACSNCFKSQRRGWRATSLPLHRMDARRSTDLGQMSLKTNSQMPVHGADGVHVGFARRQNVCSSTGANLCFRTRTWSKPSATRPNRLPSRSRKRK